MIFAFIRKFFPSDGSRVTSAGLGLGEKDFRQIADHSADLLLRTGPDLRIRYVSPSCQTILGWRRDQMIGEGPETFVLPEDFAALAQVAATHGAGSSDGSTFAFRMRHSDGTFRWMEANAQVMNDSSDAAGDRIVLLRDITQRKQLEHQLTRLAMTDGLTGLANRRAFDDALEHAWQATLRGEGPVSLLLLDLDHFKSFNDLYGHQVGDDCLRAVAAALIAVFRDSVATVARYGGEEMAVILPNAGTDCAATAGKRAQQAIRSLLLPHAGNCEGGDHVSVSIGVATAVACAGGTMRMPEGLLAAADNALYKAKRSGRNCLEKALLIAPVR